MASIRFADRSQMALIKSRAAVSPKVAALFTEEDAEGDIRVHHRGSETELQLFEVDVPPDGGASAHAHEHDEIMYVVRGQLRFGARTVEAGSSVYVTAHSLYSFKAGPDGATFLNFRRCLDASFITKAQLGERRRETRAAGAAERDE